MLLFVGFGSIIFNLLIFQKYTRRVKNHVLFSRVPYFQCIHCMGLQWPSMVVKLNAGTFVIKNRDFWFSTYFKKGNNIFAIVDFYFSLLCDFEQCCTYLNISIFFQRLFKSASKSATLFRGCWTVPYFFRGCLKVLWKVPHFSGAFEQCHNFN